MKKIFYCLIALFTFEANAKEIIVSAVGVGEDYDWAVLNAVENAVRQTSDIAITGKGLSKTDIEVYSKQEYSASVGAEDNFGWFKKLFSGSTGAANDLKLKDNSKQILAKYEGVVSSYEIVEYSEKEGVYTVKINAIVNKHDPSDYKSKDLIKKANYSLAILPFKAKSSFKCLGRKVNQDEIDSLINNNFVERLVNSRRFNLVDRSNFDNYADEISLITQDMTRDENKIRLKNIVSADYILVGTVDDFVATQEKEYIELTKETVFEASSRIRISYRMLETATMEIISAGYVDEKFYKDDEFSSCFNVEELLIRRAVIKASNDLLADVFPDYKPEVTAKPQQRKVAPAPAPDYSLPLY